MIVYIETTFLLHHGRKQKQFPATSQLLTLAQSRTIDLVIPSIAVVEAISTHHRDRNSRIAALKAIQNEVDEGNGSLRAPESLRIVLENLTTEFTQVSAHELDELQNTIADVLACGRVIEFGAEQFVIAREAQRKLGLSEIDSCAYASILTDLHDRANQDLKCFVTTDSKLCTGVAKELNEAGCKTIRSFSDGVDLIKNHRQSSR